MEHRDPRGGGPARRDGAPGRRDDGRRLSDPALAAFAEVVGAANVLTAPEELAPYCLDWTGRFQGRTKAVVQPSSTEEVAGVVAVCRQHGLAVVPQGGNTGLVGGSVPLAGEVVLSLRRLSTPAEVNARTGRLTAGAATTLVAVQTAAVGAGWTYGVDFATRDTATLGGTIATNAGGFRSLRHGATRAQLLGVEAVLGDGSVVAHPAATETGSPGYHLPALLCGSEGTLGVITAATVRLVPAAHRRVAALAGFDRVDEAVNAATALLRQLPALDAAELMLADGVEVVCRVNRLPLPFATRRDAYLLLEAAGDDDPTAALVQGLESVAGVADLVATTEPDQRAQLWRYREAYPPAIGAVGVPHKLDVALPTGRLGEFMATVPSTVGAVAPGARVWMFGHAAVGNLHVNVTGVAPDDVRVDEAVLRLAVEMGGSVGAEHGIGTAKRQWLGLSRSAAEIAAFRAIKRALDPDGVLNPHVLLPPAPGGANWGR